MQSTTAAQSDQTRMLRDSGAQFVARHAGLKRIRATRRLLPGYDEEARRKMVDSGWLGLLVPESLDGFGGSFSDMGALVEELGQGLAAEALVPALLVARTLVHCAGSDASRRQLSSLIAGDTVLALAWQGREGGLAITRDVLVRSRGGKHVLNGAKCFVAGAGGADAFIVLAHDGGGNARLYVVEKDRPNFAVTHDWRVDGTPITTLAFNDVEVSADALASGLEVHSALTRAVDETAVIVAAELVGVMRAMSELTIEYLRTRVQFGKPIGSFQALQHRMADQYVQLRLSAASVETALEVLDAPADSKNESAGSDMTLEAERERQLAASRAKARCSDAALKITREAIQLHGAMGFTDEYDASLFLKRALVLSAWLGNASQHRRRYADLLYGSSLGQAAAAA